MTDNDFMFDGMDGELNVGGSDSDSDASIQGPAPGGRKAVGTGPPPGPTLGATQPAPGGRKAVGTGAAGAAGAAGARPRRVGFANDIPGGQLRQVHVVPRYISHSTSIQKLQEHIQTLPSEFGKQVLTALIEEYEKVYDTDTTKELLPLTDNYYFNVIRDIVRKIEDVNNPPTILQSNYFYQLIVLQYHIILQFRYLESLMEKKQSVKIRFPAFESPKGEQDVSLGKGIARKGSHGWPQDNQYVTDQLNRIMGPPTGPRNGIGNSLVETLVYQFLNKYYYQNKSGPPRISLGTVGEPTPPEETKFIVKEDERPHAEFIHVWGANSTNWNLPDCSVILGGGQAAAFNKGQHAGVFGINTMPMGTLQEIQAVLAPRMNTHDKDISCAGGKPSGPTRVSGSRVSGSRISGSRVSGSRISGSRVSGSRTIIHHPTPRPQGLGAGKGSLIDIELDKNTEEDEDYEQMKGFQIQVAKYVPNSFFECLPGVVKTALREIKIKEIRNLSAFPIFLQTQQNTEGHRLIINNMTEKHYVLPQKKTIPTLKAVGLINAGQQCHALAALQLLYRLEPYRKFLSLYRQDSDLSTFLKSDSSLQSNSNLGTEQKEALIAQLFTRMDEAQDESVLDENILYQYLTPLLQNQYKGRWRAQQDSAETFNFILENIFTFLEIETRTVRTSRESDVTSEKLEYGSILPTAIQGESIQDCLTALEDEEEFEYTDRNTGDSFDHQRNDYRTGEYLLVQIKRFNRIGGTEGDSVKVFTSLDHGEGIYKLSRKSFRLEGVILHLGDDMDSGHYIFIEYQEDGSPREFNDDTISTDITQFRVSQEMLETNGYIYLLKEIKEGADAIPIQELERREEDLSTPIGDNEAAAVAATVAAVVSGALDISPEEQAVEEAAAELRRLDEEYQRLLRQQQLERIHRLNPHSLGEGGDKGKEEVKEPVAAEETVQVRAPSPSPNGETGGAAAAAAAVEEIPGGEPPAAKPKPGVANLANTVIAVQRTLQRLLAQRAAAQARLEEARVAAAAAAAERERQAREAAAAQRERERQDRLEAQKRLQEERDLKDPSKWKPGDIIINKNGNKETLVRKLGEKWLVKQKLTRKDEAMGKKAGNVQLGTTLGYRKFIPPPPPPANAPGGPRAPGGSRLEGYRRPVQLERPTGRTPLRVPAAAARGVSPGGSAAAAPRGGTSPGGSATLERTTAAAAAAPTLRPGPPAGAGAAVAGAAPPNAPPNPLNEPPAKYKLLANLPDNMQYFKSDYYNKAGPREKPFIRGPDGTNYFIVSPHYSHFTVQGPDRNPKNINYSDLLNSSSGYRVFIHDPTAGGSRRLSRRPTAQRPTAHFTRRLR